MKVMAIRTLDAPLTPKQRQQILPKKTSQREHPRQLVRYQLSEGNSLWHVRLRALFSASPN